MEKKDLEAIAQIVTQIVNSAVEASEKRMTGKIEGTRKEMLEKILESEKRMTLKIASAKEEMLGKMCAFEHDYGHEIDAIYDSAVMQKDTASQIYEESEELKKKVDNLDTKFFSLEHRVFKLEHNTNS